MKSLIPSVAAAALMYAGFTFTLRAADLPPGFVDFGRFTAPGNGGQFVEVNVNGNLISLAARLTENREPEVSDLLRGLKSVRVNVVGVDDGNRAELADRLQKIGTELAGKGWERVVTVREKKEEVGVYLKQGAGDVIEGIVVTVVDGDKEAVFVNVVGDISPEKLAVLADKLDIEPLKKIGEKTKKH